MRYASSQSKSNAAVSLAKKLFFSRFAQIFTRHFVPRFASRGAPARSGASRRPARRRSRSLHPQLVAVLGHTGEALVTIERSAYFGDAAIGVRRAPSLVATLLTLTDWLP